MSSLANFTTLHLGGPAHDLVLCTDEQSLIATVRAADEHGLPLLLLGGGSNLVVPDEGFPGVVARIASLGIECWDDEDGRAVLRIQAGEPWDSFVERCVADQLSGIECLSGIPGSAGATPIQNVGAYGQDVRETVFQVRVYDRVLGTVHDLDADECDFSYRSSRFKRHPDRWVVLSVTYRLEHSPLSRPVRYPELARALGIAVGECAPLTMVRTAVLKLRRAKGMVIDQDDPDTRSAGSFFLNPVLGENEFQRLEERVRQRLGPDSPPPRYPGPDGGIKTSAAWLIEKAGFHRGYGDPRGIAISSKHTLALTNRGAGTAAELVKLALEIAHDVHAKFGVELRPEPVLVGQRWSLCQSEKGSD